MSREKDGEIHADLPVLPPGWCWASVEQIAEVQGGIQKQPKRAPAHNAHPFLRVANVLRDRLDLSEVHRIELFGDELSRLRLRVGDLLVVEGNGSKTEIGRSALWKGEIADCVHQNHIIRVRFQAGVAAYLNAYWNSPEGNRWVVGQAASTSGLYTLSVAKVLRVPVPLAPLEEQRRIVAKLEELLSDLDAGVAALKRAQANLKRHRAAVLKAAVEGKLTEEWRAVHPNIEPAAKLLDRILTERRRRWETEQLAKFAAAGKAPPKNWQNKYVEPSPPNVAGLQSLPPGWCWVTVGQLLSEPTCNGISVKGSDQPPGVPALRLSAMSEAGFDYSERRYIPISPELASALAIRDGDFFVARGNGSLHLVGRGTLAQAAPEAIVFPDTMIRVRLASTPTLRAFINLVWQSRLVRNQLEKKARTTAGIYKISQRDIEVVIVPLPPSAEQQQLVAEVEERLSVVAATEAQVEANLQRAARLRQSILKEAFAGRLVPQDPKDEPATVLLESIRQERAASPPDGDARARSPRSRRQR